MAYDKNTWVDQSVERPRTYEITNNADGSVTLIDSFGLVDELGTPVNADYMNHIEEGIAGAAVRYYNATETYQQGEPVWGTVDEESTFYISLTNENTGSPLTDTDKWQKAELGGANLDLSNLSPIGEKHFLNKTQITNCILESPQLVDVVLSNGTLTLVSGSKVIVPYGKSAPTMAIGDTLNGGVIADISWDGANLFYIVEYTTDKSTTYNFSGAYSNVPIAVRDTGGLVYDTLSKWVAGATDTLTNTTHFWYDTNNNVVKRLKSDNTPEYQYASFPFVQCSANATDKWVSIDENFQSIGYIGTYIWVNKGVKALIPNGRNIDGTLKNIEVTTTKVQTVSRNDNTQRYLSLAEDGSLFTWGVSRYSRNNSDVPPVNDVFTWYQPDTNLCFQRTTPGGAWVEQGSVNIAEFVSSDTSVTILESYNTFQVVDYNAMLSGEIPTIVETYVNGTSWYNLYSNGWCEQGGEVIDNASNENTITFIKPFKNALYYSNCIFDTSNPCGYVVRVTDQTATTLRLRGDTWSDGANPLGVKRWEAKGYIA